MVRSRIAPTALPVRKECRPIPMSSNQCILFAINISVSDLWAVFVINTDHRPMLYFPMLFSWRNLRFQFYAYINTPNHLWKSKHWVTNHKQPEIHSEDKSKSVPTIRNPRTLKSSHTCPFNMRKDLATALRTTHQEPPKPHAQQDSGCHTLHGRIHPPTMNSSATV